MDYLHPVEALIPGARGQVLAALNRDTSARTIRQVALDAAVSWSRTSEILDDLAGLGIVERHETPGGILVRLVPDNMVARVVKKLTELHHFVVQDLRLEALEIQPPPLTLTVFGSFARGEASRDSDVDVLAVRALAADATKEHEWTESIGRWADNATAIAGNTVKLIDMDVDELPPRGGKVPGWLRAAASEGIVLVGRPLSELLATRREGARA